jgi:hypothetical protein
VYRMSEIASIQGGGDSEMNRGFWITLGLDVEPLCTYSRSGEFSLQTEWVGEGEEFARNKSS